MANKYTTEQMADLWEDVHEIENMMGRRAFHILLRQDTKTWEECWCRKATDPCLGLEKGYYRGYDALEAWFAANETVVLYPLAEPVETALTEEEMAAYHGLRTAYPAAIVKNDAGAYMHIKYVADTKRYIDSKFAALSAAIVQEE